MGSKILQCFIVGCPRSGTTLLQSFLSGHPNLISGPESHAFNMLRERRLYPAPLSTQLYENYRASMAGRHTTIKLPSATLDDLNFSKSFIQGMNELAESNKKQGWLEKTPDHLYCIRDIQAIAPYAKFIHILREPRSTVASLLEAAWRHPDAWGGSKSITWAVEMWNNAILESSRWTGLPNHFSISYEELCLEPKVSLTAVCRFLGLEFTDDLMDKQASSANDLILPMEPWKTNNKKSMTFSAQKKYSELFKSHERLIVSGLISPNAEKTYLRHIKPEYRNIPHSTAAQTIIKKLSLALEPVATRCAKNRFLKRTHENISPN